jgi:hypothetical protein
MKHVFVLGAPFSGSTLLTNLLGAHPSVFSIGELERLPQFKRYEHLVQTEPDIYQSDCMFCDATEKVCPIWSDALLSQIEKEADILNMHNMLAQRATSALGKKIDTVVDSSKTPDWLRAAARSHSGNEIGYESFGSEKVFAIITTKSVFGYAQSILSRGASLPVLIGQAWCDVSTDALRVCSSLGVPVIVVRLEELHANPALCLSRVARFLGLTEDFERGKGSVDPHHPVGGNTNAHLKLLTTSNVKVTENSWRSLHEQFSNGYLADPRKWITDLDRETVFGVASARGVHDISFLLGYDLNLELDLYLRANSGS